MAGGSGERFWPLSRFHRPKQLLQLTGSGQTLLAEAVDRVAPLIPQERIFVVTGAHLQEAIRNAELVPAENVLAEPCKRNTAGCLVYAAAECVARFGPQAEQLALAVITADNHVGAPERFRETVDVALRAVENEPVLATIGITPTRPETGFGYIEVQDGEQAARGSPGPPPVHQVARFCEKPDRQTAERFLGSGRFLWNTGMFFWRLTTFVQELEHARPLMAKTVRDLAQPIAAGDAAEVLRVFQQLENISIDYALMERAHRVVVVRGDFPWDDIGSWDALKRHLPADARGNVVVGDAVTVDASNCVVYNEPGVERMAVGVLGVEGLVVVVCEDGVLVLPKERSQDVRLIVKRLRDQGRNQV